MSARVLIIEDNLANLELMTYLLTSFGHTVLIAEEGLQGLETAGREQPDLIICDVQLPDIDGLEVARRLQQDPRSCLIPRVAVTALAMVGDRDRVLSAGFDGYVAKPIDAETFTSQMERFLLRPQHSSARQTYAPQAGSGKKTTLPRFTVLVVDNLPVHLDLARSVLAPSGYKVITAGGMAEGLALARENQCHLILSDVCMTQGNGYDFLLAVRADPQLQSIPFILITSTLMDEKDRDRGLALGATRFLRRPIEPEALLAVIDACLRNPGTN